MSIIIKISLIISKWIVDSYNYVIGKNDLTLLSSPQWSFRGVAKIDGGVFSSCSDVNK